MGKEKHLRRIEALFAKSPVVEFSSVKRIIGDEGYALLLVHNLLKSGRIKRLGKGSYTSRDNPELMALSLKPAYLGLQDAISLHRIWEQETIPVMITSRKVRTGIRDVIGTNVLIRRMDKKLIFGFDYVEENGLYLPYSDVEKTFIDMVYFRERMDESALKEFRKRIDEKKLAGYLKHYPKKFREKVIERLNG